MPMKLATTLRHLHSLHNITNKKILLEFHEYLKEVDTSVNYQNQMLKELVPYAEFLADHIASCQIQRSLMWFQHRLAICPCIFLCRNLGQNCYLNFLSPCIPVGTKASFLLMEPEQGYIAINIERIIFRNRLKVLT
jgi:hypothetical protein